MAVSRDIVIERPANASNDKITVIIPANNEEDYIVDCLNGLLAQDASAGPLDIIVAANGCSDQTVALAGGLQEAMVARGWALHVLDIEEGSKPNALNQAERGAESGTRVYLDADVICSPPLLGQMRVALAQNHPVYATGSLQVTRAKSWVTRAYADLWVRLPFMKSGAVGAGLFAVNPQGRARWEQFPAIISDDTFVRLQFAPGERIEVRAPFYWPMIEGFGGLVKVRVRQDAGVAEVNHLYPDLSQNDETNGLGVRSLLGLLFAAPVGLFVYVAVHIAVRMKPKSKTWSRGR